MFCHTPDDGFPFVVKKKKLERIDRPRSYRSPGTPWVNNGDFIASRNPLLDDNEQWLARGRGSGGLVRWVLDFVV